MDILIWFVSRIVIIGGLYNHAPSLGIAAISYFLYEVYVAVDRYYKVKKAMKDVIALSKLKQTSTSYKKDEGDKE